MSDDGQEPVPKKDFRAYQDAVATTLNALEDEIAALRRENEELQERVDTLDRVVETDDSRRAWKAMDRSDKIRRIRVKLLEEANGGRASMTYRDVYWLFDKKPSFGHCYDLMDEAADADGFAYGEGPDGSKRITVETEAVKDQQLIRATKKHRSSAEA